MDTHEMTRMQATLLESGRTQKHLLAQAIALVETHKRENALLREQLAQATATLQQVAQRLEQGGQRLAGDALREIGIGSRQILKENSVEAVEQVHRRTSEALQLLQRAVDAAGEQSHQLNRAQTTMVWKSLAFLALGGVLLVGGTSAWVWNNQQQAQRYQVDAETGRLVARSDFIQCGEGLCANVDLKAQRVGDNKQYVPVKPR